MSKDNLGEESDIEGSDEDEGGQVTPESESEDETVMVSGVIGLNQQEEDYENSYRNNEAASTSSTMITTETGVHQQQNRQTVTLNQNQNATVKTEPQEAGGGENANATIAAGGDSSMNCLTSASNDTNDIDTATVAPAPIKTEKNQDEENVIRFVSSIAGSSTLVSEGDEDTDDTDELVIPVKTCNCNSFQEKLVLLERIRKLTGAVMELSKRHALLEDFVHVKHEEEFKSFVKNRNRLIHYGYGEENPVITKRHESWEPSDLAELLSAVKSGEHYIEEENKPNKKKTRRAKKKSNEKRQQREWDRARLFREKLQQRNLQNSNPPPPAPKNANVIQPNSNQNQMINAPQKTAPIPATSNKINENNKQKSNTEIPKNPPSVVVDLDELDDVNLKKWGPAIPGLDLDLSKEENSLASGSLKRPHENLTESAENDALPATIGENNAETRPKGIVSSNGITQAENENKKQKLNDQELANKNYTNSLSNLTAAALPPTLSSSSVSMSTPTTANSEPKPIPLIPLKPKVSYLKRERKRRKKAAAAAAAAAASTSTTTATTSGQEVQGTNATP